tara:strand:+ start:11082 stop:12002 length:921 start_codon:yes stop_codon:yes gene_type:complete
VKTAIITSDTSEKHITGDGHPEQPKRVAAVIEQLKKRKNLIWMKSKKFDLSILKRVHTPKYVDSVEDSFPNRGLKFLDGDTVISPGSKQASYDAVGSIIHAIDGVEGKYFKNAFCTVRPPGHHSEKSKAMGFCIFNNAAVGAHYLIDRYNYKKIAIIDFDVHHGNGTQDIFYDNEKVLYISTHQYPFYPGSGSQYEKGKFNNIYNIPLPAGTNTENYLNAYDRVLKKIDSFMPEILIFSAGFDAHKDDPLAQFKLKSEDFFEITRRTLLKCNKFTNGKVISILEGGYDLRALAGSADEHVRALQQN